VLLLVVLSLLVLFMLVGTAFLMSSNQYQKGMKDAAKVDRLGSPPTKLLDSALMKVLRDTGEPDSAIRYHSLLRDLYGSDGFEAVVYSPTTMNLTPAGQVTRYAGATAGAPTNQLGPTQGQLIDVYVRELAFKAVDPLTPTITTAPSLPDARHVLKLEPSVNGVPAMYNMPLTKGYFNGCLLTITAGPAAGQSTRVVDFEYLGDMAPSAATGTTNPFQSKPTTRLFRFRVMAFPRADGSSLQIDQTAARSPEISDLKGATFIVNGRPFNGTGAGFNELATAGGPRLTAVETVGIVPDSATPKTKWLYPEIALTPNPQYFFASDPLNNTTNAGADLWGARYLDPTTNIYKPLNPTLTTGLGSVSVPNRPIQWKYQTFVGPGDADESYDAPDYQNLALASQTVTPRARGRVVVEDTASLTGSTTYEIGDPAVTDASGAFSQANQFLRLDLEDLPLPSYYRPDLENYWFHRLAKFVESADGVPFDEAVRAVLQPYGIDGIRGNDPGVSVEMRDQIVALKRKISLRPLREDHPSFDGSNPASRPTTLPATVVRGDNIAIPYWEAVGPWDVDNDNDGVPDSMWVDLGDPIAQAEDGTLYKPLYAFLIVDLDSRLNVNAHGLVDDLRRDPNNSLTPPNLDFGIISATGLGPGNLSHDLVAGGLNTSNYLPHGLGYGPAEISLRSIFSPNLPGNADTMLAARVGNPAYDDYARILVGRPAVVDQPSVWGRHGSVNIRGDATIIWTNDANAATEAGKVRPGTPFDTTSIATQTATLDQLTMFKYIGYPLWLTNYYGLTPTPSAFANPPDLMGRYAIGLDYAGQPVVEQRADLASAFSIGLMDGSLLFDSPYELNLSDPNRRDEPAPSVSATIAGAKTAAINDDAPFATADLERILRAHDADAGVLPDRLWNLVDAFDPVKLFRNQPAAVTAKATEIFGSGGDPELLAAAQELAGVNRRLVTTDSYDLPVPGAALLSRLVYGADGQPGQAWTDTNGNGIRDEATGDDDGDASNLDSDPQGILENIDEPDELGWGNTDDWYPIMNGIRTPGPPPVGVRLVPEHPTLVDLLKYRIQYERWKRWKMDPTLPVLTEPQLTVIVNELLSPELLAGRKMDLNRPLGDGRDNGDGFDNDGINGVDDPGELNYPIGSANRDPYMNGIVDDPLEAGEPFLDVNGNGKWDVNEPYVDMIDRDNIAGDNPEYDGPLDHLWDGLTSEPITFDYSNGQAVPIRADVAADVSASLGNVPVVGGVRNLNSQGRQLLARQLYCLMLLLVDENYLDMPDLPSLDGNNFNLELQRVRFRLDRGLGAFDPLDPNDIELRHKLTAKRIAQWAINCVDMRDADSIMTPFEYDENPWDGWGCPDANGVNIPLDGDVATDENRGEFINWATLDPTNANMRKPVTTLAAADAPVSANQTRGVVWGVERPELLITETLAFHDRRATDEPDYGSVANPPSFGATADQRDYELDQRLKPRGSLFVELYNPWTPDGNKPREFYGQVPTDPTNSQGVMLNRLSDLPDPVSGNYSPVWRMSILRDPLNGRMPIFRNPATGKLDSGVLKMVDDPSTPDVEGFGPPDPDDKETVSADFLTIDPDGYAIDLDENAERQVYFTTGRNYATDTGSDANRSDDDHSEWVPSNPLSVGDWQFKDAAGVSFADYMPPRPPIPVVNQLKVRVPPLSKPRTDVTIGGTTLPPVPTAKRYFIARNDRKETANPNDVDATIAPIMPGRYAVVGSSGLQLRGIDASTSSTADGLVTTRFVTPLSRAASQPEDSSGDSQWFGPGYAGRLPKTRRIELWPDPTGNPNSQQVLVAENGGPEFVRVDSNTVVNVTDPDGNGDPTNTPLANLMIDPAVAIPVEDLNISEPVEGYPSIAYREMYESNAPVDASGNRIPLDDHAKASRLAPSGELVYPTTYKLTTQGDLEYDPPFDRPLDTEFDLIRNGTTQNYRSIHLQRLADPTLPWNPWPFDSAGNSNPLHRAWLPVNPYRTIDSQSVDLTAYNGASQLERTKLPGGGISFSQDFTSDWLQSNILAPITATQLLNGPDHEIWAMILLMKLKDIPIGNSPDLVRDVPAAVESALTMLEDLAPGARGVMTAKVDEILTPPRRPKFPNGMVDGWSWHMYRRTLPDDSLTGASPNGFRQWLHFKSLERGFHASNYFKYPKPGAFFAANPATLEGWAPDISVLPRTLWRQERPNARLFLEVPAGISTPVGISPGIVDAADLKNATSWRVLSNTPATPRLTPQEKNTTMPESEISRNLLIWNSLAASATPSTQPTAVFDYVLEQTLGFANRSYTPDLERELPTGDVAATLLTINPKPGAPEVATTSNRRPADFIADDKEIWNAQRQAAKLSTSVSNPPTVPGPSTPQPSLLRAVDSDGDILEPLSLEGELVAEFYQRRKILTRSTYPWLTWNDRPFVSSEEIMQVPASSSSLMLRDYSLINNFTPNPYDGNTFVSGTSPLQPKAPAQQLAAQHAPFGHLLNFFATSGSTAVAATDPLLPTGAPNFQRILDYVEVPSRYVGTETMLSPEIFNDVPTTISAAEPVGTDISGVDDPRYALQPPFNTISRQRDPGRVNLNTVTGRRTPPTSSAPPHIWSEVYDGIMHRYGDGNLWDASAATPTLLQFGHLGPAWRDVALSRRGYAQFNADAPVTGSTIPVDKLGTVPDTFAFGLNKEFPSIFSNPFRSASAGDLVPLDQLQQYGVDASWLRSHPRNRGDDGGWGISSAFGEDDNGDLLTNDQREAGFGDDAISRRPEGAIPEVQFFDTNPDRELLPLFCDSAAAPAIDALRNPGMMYQPMTRLGNLVTTRSNVYAIWVTVGYFEVERAPDWNETRDLDGNGTPDGEDTRARFGGTTTDTDDATIRARALYDRVYPEGYMLGQEVGSDTGNTKRQRAFYIIDRTEPVGFKPGEDLNVERMIRVRRRIE
jgi:hypothetical protein